VAARGLAAHTSSSASTSRAGLALADAMAVLQPAKDNERTRRRLLSLLRLFLADRRAAARAVRAQRVHTEGAASSTMGSPSARIRFWETIVDREFAQFASFLSRIGFSS
jgi:hypothetical protein